MRYWRRASATACVRLRAPNFACAFFMCVRTVSSPRSSSLAICLSGLGLAAPAKSHADSALRALKLKLFGLLAHVVFRALQEHGDFIIRLATHQLGLEIANIRVKRLSI